MITDELDRDDETDPGAAFARAIVLEVFRIEVRDRIGAAPDREKAEAAVFHEVLSRIDWNARTVASCGHDIGPVGIGVTRVAVATMKFGWFCALQGIALADPDTYQQTDQ